MYLGDSYLGLTVQTVIRHPSGTLTRQTLARRELHKSSDAQAD
ncbi:uncharacterized protein METZ01_LOCUS504156, partial [marine metagenome]